MGLLFLFQENFLSQEISKIFPDFFSLPLRFLSETFRQRSHSPDFSR